MSEGAKRVNTDALGRTVETLASGGPVGERVQEVILDEAAPEPVTMLDYLRSLPPLRIPRGGIRYGEPR